MSTIALAWRRARIPHGVLLAALLAVLLVGAALLAPWIAPSDPTDISTYNLADSELPRRFPPLEY